jgi:hypothetical protein
MLCQLSYASVRMEKAEKDRASQAKYSIFCAANTLAIQPLPGAPRSCLLEREGKAAANRALALGEIERAAVGGQEGTIALSQKIPDIDQRLSSVG